MGNSKKSLVAAAAAVALVMVGVLHASERDDPAVQKTLRAMANADTDWHPDLAGEFNGLRAYAHGKFQEAMRQFLAGAYYSDKLSQLSIGLMYLNGEGVAKDPVAAYAWLDLAAERAYAGFATTRDRVKMGLTAGQLQQAEAKRTELAATYADAVAKPRLARQLQVGQMQLTGSRLGYNSGVIGVAALPGLVGDAADLTRAISRCAGPTVLIGYQNAPISGCGGDAIYTAAFWQPDKYFASRDALWRSEVIVGPIRQENAGRNDKDIKPP